MRFCRRCWRPKRRVDMHLQNPKYCRACMKKALAPAFEALMRKIREEQDGQK